MTYLSIEINSQVFEALVFKYLKEKFGIDVKVWHRWSDQCSAQFKSSFTMHKLSVAREDLGLSQNCVIHWHNFETNEGKNMSDSIGSCDKHAYEKGVMMNPDKAFRTAEDVANLIRANQKEETAKFCFKEIFTVDRFEREKNPPQIVLNGIQKQHSFSLTEDGRILCRLLSCLDCIKTSSVCETCNSSSQLVYRPNPPMTLDEEPEEYDDPQELDVGDENEFVEDDEEVQEDEIDDVDDRSCYGESDVEDEEGLVDEQEDEDEPLGPGSIIWVRRRSWFPGRVVDVHNLPQGTKKYLPEHPENELIVELFPPFCDVVIAKRGRIERLNESASDKEKASKSEDVNAAYNQALAVKNGLI